MFESNLNYIYCEFSSKATKHYYNLKIKKIKN